MIFILAITVSFTQSTYRVKEENVTLKPVIVLNGSSSVEIILKIQSTNVLAIGIFVYTYVYVMYFLSYY